MWTICGKLQTLGVGLVMEAFPTLAAQVHGYQVSQLGTLTAGTFISAQRFLAAEGFDFAAGAAIDNQKACNSIRSLFLLFHGMYSYTLTFSLSSSVVMLKHRQAPIN